MAKRAPFRNRQADLRVAHGRGCVNHTRTALSSLHGCTCTPTYYTLYREGTKTKKSPRVPDLATARQLQHELQRDITRRRLADIPGAEVRSRQGATLDSAYAGLRRTIADLDAIRPKLELPAARKQVGVALDVLYGAEDVLTTALRLA